MLDAGVRIRVWRAEHGAEKDVIFRQKHESTRPEDRTLDRDGD